jgi:hypothetical protein
LPVAIADGGEIAGWDADAGNADHGFLRDAKGNYTVVDDPDAVSGKLDSGTFVTAIHNSGTIAGYYDDQPAQSTASSSTNSALSRISTPRRG